MIIKAAKTVYSEQEAAESLGITVEALRSLVKNHITREEELPDGACASLKPADLLLLRMLSNLTRSTTAA